MCILFEIFFKTFFCLIFNHEHAIVHLEMYKYLTKMKGWMNEWIIFILYFSDRAQLKKVDAGSAKAEYDLAAELGLVSRSQVVCRQRYSTCPFTSDEMMKALRTANL